jgi:hypothetical protein
MKQIMQKNINQMKKFLFAIAILFFSLNLLAQNCQNTSVGFPPVADLGTGYWRGFQGGLYSNGSNYRPAAHNIAGMNIAQNILPLDTAGNVDMTNGKIVWLSVGMSNTTMETQLFLPMADTCSQINPQLILIDGAQGGQDITIIDDPNAAFWNNILNRLAQSGLTSKQVQVIWFKEAEANPTDTSFTTYPDALKSKFKTALQIEKNKFPNTKLAYLSNRIYAGYASSQLNPEPYAYYASWSVKRLIEDQVNGDTSLAYTGANARVPWLAWGADLWADGTTPRSDGLTWICPDDYNSDGTHPSNPIGRQKVANLLYDFFTTDSTTVPWFLNQTSVGMNTANYQEGIKIFPNPSNTVIKISSGTALNQISILNTLGEILTTVHPENLSGESEIIINISDFPKGIYFIRLNNNNSAFAQKLIVD